MEHHQLAINRLEHIELDRICPQLSALGEGGQRILGLEVQVAADTVSLYARECHLCIELRFRAAT